MLRDIQLPLSVCMRQGSAKHSDWSLRIRSNSIPSAAALDLGRAPAPGGHASGERHPRPAAGGLRDGDVSAEANNDERRLGPAVLQRLPARDRLDAGDVQREALQ
jgi:hypothetical protein